jgi:ubiquinone biosynthesis monooxygenase Coq7
MTFDQVIRVDHAGELGATLIYRGQILGARLRREPTVDLEKMLAHEQQHLDYFTKLQMDNDFRPSKLLPLWRVAGFCLGLGSGLLGEKTRSQVTASVETVVDQHYAKQITWARENSFAELADKMESFRSDELDHKTTALKDLTTTTKGIKLLGLCVEAGCRLALNIEEKL